MRATVLGMLVAATATQAAAQMISGTFDASHDSDSFDERKESIGYTGAKGWGLKAGALQYAAPGLSENGSSLAGTYQQKAPERQVDASLGVTRLARHDYLVGAFDYLQTVRTGTSLGLSMERDFVNSVGGIQRGLTYNSLALVADHAFTPRLNLGLSAGATSFSNDNDRPLLRTRLNYSVDERYGLNVYLKTRNYQNSNPRRPEYFSPRRLNEASLGLSSRFALADLMVVSARADVGRQRIDGVSQSIWSAALTLASRRDSKLQWLVGLEATNSASASAVATEPSSYRYVSAVARLSFPL